MAVKQPQPKMHLTQYLYVLKRRWVLVVMFWVVIFAGVTVVTYTQDPQYKAEAELMIGSTYAAPESMETQTSGLSAEFFNSQYRIIRSRDVAKKLYNHFQYYNKQVFRDLAPDQDPYAIVQKWILVTPVPKSQNVKVWTVMPDPDEGHRFVNKVCDLYLEFVAEQKKQTLEKSQSVLAQRIDQILRNIEETNRDIQVFSKQHDIYVLPDIRSAILERQNWLQEAVGAASIDNVTRWTDSLEISKAIDEGQPLDIRDNDLLERLREKSHALA